jgi:ferric-dicitrate binding protein FerR (iron transport regulator)
MAKTNPKQAERAVRYARRAIEDEYAQEQLRKAVAQLRDVYMRASRQGSKASEDKKLYAKVREAAKSMRKAVGAIEEPSPPKRRGRELLALAGVAAIVMLVLRRGRGSSQPDSATPNGAYADAPGESRASDGVAPEPVR